LILRRRVGLRRRCLCVRASHCPRECYEGSNQSEQNDQFAWKSLSQRVGLRDVGGKFPKPRKSTLEL